MTLPVDEVTRGFVDEHEAFAKFVAGLSPEEWSQPSRCEGWTVADVAAHVTGTIADIVAGRLDGLGTPEVTEREVVERRGRTPGEIADELSEALVAGRVLLDAFDADAWASPAPGGYDGTLLQGIEALWYDAFLHADDIRAAIGRPTETGPGLRAALHHIAHILERSDFGPATLALDGAEEVPIGGGGDRITGDPMAFVLAATGRGDAVALGFGGVPNIYG